MKRPASVCLTCLALALITPIPANAEARDSLIIKTNGEVVLGQIQGHVVTKYQVSNWSQYVIWDGADITRVENLGIGRLFAYDTAAKPMLVSCPVQSARDLAVLEAAVKSAPPGTHVEGIQFVRLPASRAIMQVRQVQGLGDLQLVGAGSIIGEVRFDPQTGKTDLLPAIEVLTREGIVSLSVNEIGGNRPQLPAHCEEQLKIAFVGKTARAKRDMPTKASAPSRVIDAYGKTRASTVCGLELHLVFHNPDDIEHFGYMQFRCIIGGMSRYWNRVDPRLTVESIPQGQKVVVVGLGIGRPMSTSGFDCDRALSVQLKSDSQKATLDFPFYLGIQGL